MLPYVDRLPASSNKQLIIESVATPSSFDLWYPIFGIGLGGGSMEETPVPKAAVHEDCHSRAGEKYVCYYLEAGRAG